MGQDGPNYTDIANAMETHQIRLKIIELISDFTETDEKKIISNLNTAKKHIDTLYPNWPDNVKNN